MPCIAQGAREKLACMKCCLYYSSFPLDAGDRAAKCKRRAVKTSGVCMLTDSQLSLLLKEHQRLKANSKCHLAPEYLHTMYDCPVKARETWASLGVVPTSLNVQELVAQRVHLRRMRISSPQPQTLTRNSQGSAYNTSSPLRVSAPGTVLF